MKLWGWIKSLFTHSTVDYKPEPKKPLPAWYRIALSEIGVKEVPGEGNNPRVIEYHYATSLKATEDSVPWCASFVCWCLQVAGVKSTRNARARSYLNWGRPVQDPYEGCIVVLSRGNKYQGHVGFFVRQDKDHVWLLGGNQNDQVNVTKFSKKSVLDYREPA